MTFFQNPGCCTLLKDRRFLLDFLDIISSSILLQIGKETQPLHVTDAFPGFLTEEAPPVCYRPFLYSHWVTSKLLPDFFHPMTPNPFSINVEIYSQTLNYIKHHRNWKWWSFVIVEIFPLFLSFFQPLSLQLWSLVFITWLKIYSVNSIRCRNVGIVSETTTFFL